MHAFSKKLLLNIFLLYELSDGFRTKECKTQEMENVALAISTAMVLCSIVWWITNSIDQREGLSCVTCNEVTWHARPRIYYWNGIIPCETASKR